MKNSHKIDHGNFTKALRKRLSLDFSSSFSFFSLISVKTSYKWCWTPSLQPFTPIYKKWGEEVAQQLAQASYLLPPEVTCSPRRAGYFISKFSNGPRWAQGLENVPKVTILPHFEYLADFLLKHHKTLRIVWQLALSSSIRLTRIHILANDRPQTKLGYDE